MRGTRTGYCTDTLLGALGGVEGEPPPPSLAPGTIIHSGVLLAADTKLDQFEAPVMRL